MKPYRQLTPRKLNISLVTQANMNLPTSTLSVLFYLLQMLR